MPLYEYVCQQCQHPFEAIVFGDAQPECPQCHGRQLERLLSLPARPPAESSGPAACRSSGPPCGPVCGRWKQ